MHLYISQVYIASRIEDSSHYRDALLNSSPPSTLHITAAWNSNWRIKGPMTGRCSHSSNCHINTEETQISLAGLFFWRSTYMEACKTTPSERYVETNDKEEMGIPLQSFRKWMAQDASIHNSKSKKNLKGNLPAFSFPLGYFKWAVSCRTF